jgi:hypothetical protein
VGVVTIDDVLDYLLPDDWRSHDEESRAPRVSSATGSVRTVQPRKKVSRGSR